MFLKFIRIIYKAICHSANRKHNMEIFKNVNGGVLTCGTSHNSITVQFKGGPYIYDYNRPDNTHVEQMKVLVRQGRGLNKLP